METTNSNHNNNNKPAKLCRYGCGKQIRWDTVQNAFIEIDTNYNHRCPNWNPKHEYHSTSLNRKITPEQQQYADTLGPLIAKILSLVQEIHQQTVQNVRNSSSY